MAGPTVDTPPEDLEKLDAPVITDARTGSRGRDDDDFTQRPHRVGQRI